MAKSNARTVYATADTWDGWKDKAWSLRLSVSELIRRAVEAYDGLGGESASRVMPGVNEQPREGKVGGLEPRTPKAPPFRRPVTKAVRPA